MAASTEVIVVGAGFAGLAAATRLRKRGMSVTVLEARDEAGGRARTSTALGFPLDLGASWLHGVRDHPLYERAQALGVAHTFFDYDSVRLYRADGEPETTSEGLIEHYERALEKLGRKAGSRDSVADRLPTLDRRLREQLPESLQDFLVANVLEEEYAADREELAARALEEGRSMRGGDVLLHAGHAALYGPLCSKLDLRLSTVVRKIEVRRDGVSLDTSAGHFRAEHVILTVPLGVLKAGTIRISPALDEEHREAIDALGMGLLNKLYLKFPRRFWDPDYQVASYQHAERGRWVSWYNFAPITDRPVLLGFCAARAAAAVEALDDTSAVADAMAVLRTMYGSAVPDPEAALLTRWGQDPYSLGAYSFLKAGARPSLRERLAVPVKGRLWIAGEATDRRYPGTTQGAWRAGRQAAKAILARRKTG